jgi:hypothetical protein
MLSLSVHILSYPISLALPFNLISVFISSFPFPSLPLTLPPSPSHPSHPLQVIEGWFLDIPIAQIYHGNFAQWTSWAFFGKEWTHLTAQEVCKVYVCECVRACVRVGGCVVCVCVLKRGSVYVCVCDRVWRVR